MNLIPGSGPVPAEGMLVGEAGGESEDRSRRPFIGKAGGVLSTYLRAADLSRSELFITNVFPFWTGPGNPDPTPEQILSEEARLVADLERVQPKVVGAVGRIAARWFIGDIDISDVHGIPHFSPKTPALVVPITHPAAGFYEPERAAWSQDDILLFAHYLKNPVDTRSVPDFNYVLHRDPPPYIEGSIDTEGLEDRPWGLSWCVDGRTCNVYVYSKDHTPPKIRGYVEFHNAPHDLKILRAMNISTTGIDFGDTMVRLFNLQLEPQGLKPAAYRHLGLKMQSFDEVVRPHFNKLAIRWLRIAASFEYPKPAPIPVADFKQKKNRLYRPQSAGRRIQNVLRSWHNDQRSIEQGIFPEKPIKLEKRWEKIGETDWADLTELYHAQAERSVGTPFPDFSIFCVPEQEATDYSGLDAGATNQLAPRLDKVIAAKGLKRVYETDRRALRFVDRMQEVGMRVEVEELKKFEADLETLREQAARKIRHIVGNRWFNPGSSDQVARWLYSLKGLPVMTYTDTGRGSTSDASLQMLRGYHAEDPDVAEFLKAEQDYRECDKYIGTYTERIFAGLKRDRDGNWRLHDDFRVTRVVSGRLSSSIVLMLPVKTALGRRFRSCFVAGEGYTLVDCDLSQLELRVGAHFSGDRTMRQAFDEGKDLHALTASLIFKVALETILKDSIQRYMAKIVNFAVFYGISPKALLEQLYISNIFSFMLQDCEKFILEWFKIFSSVKSWQKRIWTQAEKDGFVRTILGRICYVPNIRLLDEKMRDAARRLATNFPVQGTGSDVTKRAEIRVNGWIEDNGLREDVRPWLQMHDELLLEVKTELAEEVKKVVSMAMTADAGMFSVPLKADARVGRSWGEAKG